MQDTSLAWPIFSDGTKIQKGENICRDSYGVYIKDSKDSAYGIPYEILRPAKNICRKIVDISPDRIPERLNQLIYVTTFSEEKFYELDYDKEPKCKVIQNEFVFFDEAKNIIELYRKDGTLRFEGSIQFQNAKLLIHGYCIDKKTEKKGRKTNNPNICK
ncbi:MAG: hypothetical protein VZQ49_00590 [Methanobrevibacter sp.]|nr:hypothetical protein [Methanobrevibacter sp.]